MMTTTMGGPPPTEPDITVVCGEYAGTMVVAEAAPLGEDVTEESAGTAVEAKVTGEAIEFSNFPVRDLIVKILGTEEDVDEILAAIGQVDYNLPYTAQMSEDKASVTMTFKPEVLKLTLPGGEGEDSGAEIEVTIEATDGTYRLESKTLEFGLAVTGVKVAGIDLPGFESFSLDFDLAKNRSGRYPRLQQSLRNNPEALLHCLHLLECFRGSSQMHSTELLPPQYGRHVRSLPSIRVTVTYARPVTRSMVIHERLR